MRAVLGLVLLSALPMPARAQSATTADSVAAVAPAARLTFDFITRDAYLRRHAFSLDHFLEFEPGGVVARLGPIGNDAYYSRWGMGRGRAVVTVNGVSINDPQDGTAPLLHIATSGLAAIAFDGEVDPARASGMEGTLALTDLTAPRSRPHTFIELSKGTNEVRQRRVRFGSEAGKVGLDLSYDEVLDDGYNFDANDVLFPADPPEGKALSRNGAVVVRGELEEQASYSIGLRRFRSSTTGDLQSATNEATRSGHLAWASVSTGGVEATAYGRGYSSDRPDSATVNQTAGGVISWRGRRGDALLRVFGSGEHTNATQDVGGASARDRASLAAGGVSAETKWGATEWFAHGNVAVDEQQGAWGGGAGVQFDVPSGDMVLSARRSFRLPSLGERYLPEHARDGFTISGDRSLDPETAWEGSAGWTLRSGAFTNRVRGSWIQSEDYISFTPVPGNSLARRSSNSSRNPSMSFIEERLAVVARLGAFDVRGDAGGSYTTGDREGAFRSVPRVQANASLTVGRELFEKSSALYLEGSYAFMDERQDYNGVPLDAYHVVNVGILGRLLDVRLYLKWLNLLDSSYQTVSGYLMTPRTLAYGIEWTLFD